MVNRVNTGHARRLLLPRLRERYVRHTHAHTHIHIHTESRATYARTYARTHDARTYQQHNRVTARITMRRDAILRDSLKLVAHGGTSRVLSLSLAATSPTMRPAVRETGKQGKSERANQRASERTSERYREADMYVRICSTRQVECDARLSQVTRLQRPSRPRFAFSLANRDRENSLTPPIRRRDAGNDEALK